ncbi:MULTISPECIES: hypothetical protein [unclassified Roseofilum]|nr:MULTISPECIES: hypothetical protein [unclassified Roseofilum]
MIDCSLWFRGDRPFLSQHFSHPLPKRTFGCLLLGGDRRWVG